MKNALRYLIPSLFLGGLMLQASAQKKIDNTPSVNVFIGTGGHGHTYPGPSMPFGMVQLSPDTRLEGWDGCSGYHYTDSLVYGFSHTHLSGTGCSDYGDILFMPTTGEPKLLNTEYRSSFRKKYESGSPGYYKTRLDKYNVNVELTATPRVGVHHYDYPNTPQANIIIDLKHRDEVRDAWIEVVNDHEVRGFRRSKGWAEDQYVYFYARFSKPFKTYGVALNDQVQQGKTKVEGKNVKMYLQFDNPGDVVSEVALSSVSAEGALKNLDAEMHDYGFDFKKIEKAAHNTWVNELAKIQVEGGSPPPQQSLQSAQNLYNGYNPYGGYSVGPQPKAPPVVIDQGKIKRNIFYTALYHTMLAPNIYNDVDGQYRGMDQKVHTANGFNYYTIFSLWDTYRAEHPLLTIIDKKRTLDFIKTFLAMYDEDGVLPVWPVGSWETYCMVGNHSIPVIVDAYSKGVRDFNTDKALYAMKAVVNRKQFGLGSYKNNGAVLADDNDESVSKTLEYAIDDWCIAQFAKMLNKQADYDEYIKRAQYWKNLYNNQNGYLQARTNGSWYAPFDPSEVNQNYTEGNARQYAFLVPQDVETLIAKMGGRNKFEARLDELFNTKAKITGKDQPDISGLIGQYAHGNEPSHHIAYLYNFTDDPTKTQLYLSKIMKDEYSDGPDGLAGNEDCGQMSAWYVMSALGIYNLMPGGQQYQVGLPQFDKAVISLENGKKFTVYNAAAASSNIYLQGMSLNKKPYNKLYLTYDDINKGGDFEYFAGRLPNRLFVQDLEKPSSKIVDDLIVSNPYFVAPSGTFKDNISIEIKCADADAKIYYTTDGSAPTASSTLYAAPVKLTKTTILKAIAVKDGKSSFVDAGVFKKGDGK
ncbi:putative alpha-1,2-mannosidase [Mucilaginibacter yixingensis]|uniref:Putative alpha-1,2-mannosidase n=1 Tax=Mucilaginibacter yixingensis TaxID=1295612 RepID=A0A2T5J6L7_9SPHI|nr:GH92 family glycosyl hydrolase [Mucilaginibacter yixingensis]PTQ94808.1 putative alpha-1,2-mannosidase [Mucilaginibacter yixingensis]